MAMRLIAGSASIGIPNWCRSAWSASDGYDVAEYESSQHHDTTRYWRRNVVIADTANADSFRSLLGVLSLPVRAPCGAHWDFLRTLHRLYMYGIIPYKYRRSLCQPLFNALPGLKRASHPRHLKSFAAPPRFRVVASV